MSMVVLAMLNGEKQIHNVKMLTRKSVAVHIAPYMSLRQRQSRTGTYLAFWSRTQLFFIFLASRIRCSLAPSSLVSTTRVSLLDRKTACNPDDVACCYLSLVTSTPRAITRSRVIHLGTFCGFVCTVTTYDLFRLRDSSRETSGTRSLSLDERGIQR